ETAATGRVFPVTDAPPQCLGEALGDRRPQSTASISACQRSIGLFKSVEQAWLQSLRHANAGIDDLETDRRYVRASGRTERHPYFNTAVLGELDRIAGQIEQDLPHAPVIAMQAVGHTGLDEHAVVQS